MTHDGEPRRMRWRWCWRGWEEGEEAGSTKTTTRGRNRDGKLRSAIGGEGQKSNVAYSTCIILSVANLHRCFRNTSTHFTL